MNRIPITQQQRIGKSLGATMIAHPPRVGRNLRTPINEVAAAELSKSGGSINAVANGRLIRISAGPNDWDVSASWLGRELVGWTKRYSHWDKMIVVSFYVELSTNMAKLPTFTLALKPPLTDEEVQGAAEVYMSLLNLARVV